VPKKSDESLAGTPAPRSRWGAGARAGTGETRLEQALEAMRAVMVEADAQGRNRYVSPSLLGVLGYDSQEVLGRVGLTFVHRDDHAVLVEMAARLHATGEPTTSVFRARHKSGHWVWLETTSTRLQSAEGESYSITFARDVSEAKRAEEARRESEDRFRTLAEHSVDLVIELDDSGRFLFVSPSVERVLGQKPESLLGRSFVDFASAGVVHPDDRAGLLEGFALSVESGPRSGRREFRGLHADGSWRWFEGRFQTYRTQGGAWRAVVICRDVTERRRTQEELRESEDRYRAITAASNEIILELDAEGRVTYVSRAVQVVLGQRPEECVGTTMVPLVHPEDVEACVDAFLGAVSTEQPVMIERHRARHRDGSWRWLEGQGIPYRRADAALRFVFLLRDVTATVRAEQERAELEGRVRQAQRLEGLGVMAGGIAHDFNNLLTPILGDSSLALMDLPDDSPLRRRLQRIQQAARRAASLTHQMLAYAGKGPLHTELLDLSALVREMAQLLESSVDRRAELVLELADDLPPVQGDSAQLAQVVMNLLTNASEALGESGGRIAVRTGIQPAHRSPQASLLGDQLPDGPVLYFEVEDDGCGMDAETRRRIFDPFFTTKFTGRGLGLAAALGIVRGHRGAIEIDSEPGRGTRFRILLPVGSAAAARGAPPPACPDDWRSSGSVLVVDDDAGVRALTRETLERAGLRVLTAADGRSGAALFERHADEIDLVILDGTMPGAGGEEALEAIRRLRPDATILVASGFSEKRAAERFGARGPAGFLRKPFLPQSLLAEVRRLLAPRDASQTRFPDTASDRVKT
jgi:PAS domain S-box-containing protein